MEINDYEDFLKDMMYTSQVLIEKIDEFIRLHDLYNEQYVIDWQDNLNKISIMP